MDCPHCGTENLIGASLCAACGKSMISRPRFGPGAAPPGEPAPGPVSAAVAASTAASARPRAATVRSAADELASASSAWTPAASSPPGAGGDVVTVTPGAPLQVLCRVCSEAFDRPADDKGVPICPSCRGLSADVAKMAPNDVQMHPDTAPDGAPALANRLGSAQLRPRPVAARKVGLRTGPVAAAAGLVLVVLGLAVVAVARREPDRAAEILGDVRPGPLSVDPMPPDGFVARVETRVKLDILREEARSFGAAPSRVIDVRQTTLQTAEAAFLRADDGALVFDVASEGRVVDQLGKVGPEDGREASLYPWVGPHGTIRVRAADRLPAEQLDGSPATAGCDVPPVFHLGALRPAGRAFAVGDRWRSEIALPALVDRQGRLLSVAFPAEVAFAGRAVRNGYACAAFRVTATLPQVLPPMLEDAFNRRSGRIVGAVWIELTTGVVAGADLDVDLRLRREAGRVEDDLALRGRITVDRK